MDDPVLLGVREPGEQPSSTPPIWASDMLPTYGRSEPRSTYSIAMYGVPVVLEVVVHGDDVRVAQRPGDARLAQEALGERGVGRVEGRELLQRDEAVEVGLPGEVDHGHAAAADLAEDLVAADRLQDIRHRLTSLSSRKCGAALSISSARA